MTNENEFVQQDVVSETTASAEAVKENNGKQYTAKQVLDYLYDKFPVCFKKESSEVRPLKLGILSDIVDAISENPEYSKTAIRHGIQLYTGSWAYLESCKEDAVRLSLDGSDAGTVSKEHADYAAQKLAESKKRYAEKKAKQAAENPNKKPKFSKNPQNRKNVGDNRQNKFSKKPGFSKKANNGNRNFKPKKFISPDAFVNPSLDSLKIDDKVYVQIGYDPRAKKISGRIKKIEKDDIYVDLISGMSLKLGVDNIYVYDESKLAANKEDCSSKNNSIDQKDNAE